MQVNPSCNYQQDHSSPSSSPSASSLSPPSFSISTYNPPNPYLRRWRKRIRQRDIQLFKEQIELENDPICKGKSRQMNYDEWLKRINLCYFDDFRNCSQISSEEKMYSLKLNNVEREGSEINFDSNLGYDAIQNYFYSTTKSQRTALQQRISDKRLTKKKQISNHNNDYYSNDPFNGRKRIVSNSNHPSMILEFPSYFFSISRQHENLSTSSESETESRRMIIKKMINSFKNPPLRKSDENKSIQKNHQVKCQITILTTCGICKQRRRQRRRRRRRREETRNQEEKIEHFVSFPRQNFTDINSKSNLFYQQFLRSFSFLQIEWIRAYNDFRRRPLIEHKRRQKLFLSMHSFSFSSCFCGCLYCWCFDRNKFSWRHSDSASYNVNNNNNRYYYYYSLDNENVHPFSTVSRSKENLSKCSKINFLLTQTSATKRSSPYQISFAPFNLPFNNFSFNTFFSRSNVNQRLARISAYRHTTAIHFRILLKLTNLSSRSIIEKAGGSFKCASPVGKAYQRSLIESNRKRISSECDPRTFSKVEEKFDQIRPIDSQVDSCSQSAEKSCISSKRSLSSPKIQDKFHQNQSEGSGESSSNSSQNNMAEQSHQSGQGSERGEGGSGSGDNQGSGGISGNFGGGSSGGGSGGGGEGSGGGGGGREKGGDDRQSSATSGLGKSGEEIDGRRYHLRIVQQPETGCAFGENLLSRLAIAPPLIVQVRVTDNQNKEIDFDDEIPSLICRVNLLTEDGQNADMLSPMTTTTTTTTTAATSPSVSQQQQQQSQRITSPSTTWQVSSERESLSRSLSSTMMTEGQRPINNPSLSAVSMLYGTLVSSPFRLLDVNQNMRTFFIFPEISVRSRGRFRLNIVLIRLPFSGNLRQQSNLSTAGPSIATDPSQQSSNPEVQETTSTTTPFPSSNLASIISDPFEVVLSRDYQAPHITELTRHFASNGVGLLLPPTQASNE